MDYEKKYKDALARAKELCDVADTFTLTIHDIITIFPELKESEDERIRKEIIDFLGLPHPQFVGKRDHEKWIAWLEKQNEQKPGVKIKPKFHEGEWVILTAGELSTTLQIGKVDTDKKLYWFNDDSYLPVVDEECLHRWTIQDAKAGDVLAYVTDEEDLWIMIYRSLYEPYEGHVHYHALLVNDNFSDKGTCCICIDNLKPATKEQQELLFQKMKEAGYEWDADKKELKKIEVKTLNADKVIAWLVANICDFEHYVKLFKRDFGL